VIDFVQHQSHAGCQDHNNHDNIIVTPHDVSALADPQLIYNQQHPRGVNLAYCCIVIWWSYSFIAIRISAGAECYFSTRFLYDDEYKNMTRLVVTTASCLLFTARMSWAFTTAGPHLYDVRPNSIPTRVGSSHSSVRPSSHSVILHMNLFDRFTRVAKSNLNNILKNLEDPEKIMTQVWYRAASHRGPAWRLLLSPPDVAHLNDF
jgi:hypothetical protein